MTSVGSAWYELDARDEKLKRALDDAERDVKRAASEAETGFGQRATAGMDNFARSTQSAGGFLRQAAATAAGFVAAQASIHLVSRGWDTLKNAVFGTNASLETSTLQFQTLMGDADRARDHVEMLFEFAKRTPFETGPIIAASKHLQVFGGDALNTRDNLTLVGDAAAAMSVNMDEVAFWVGRAYNAIQAGKPFGESAMRLQEMGILTAEARTRMEEMQAAGADVSEVWGVMNDDLGRLTGAMELQAGTWQGLTSTFTDTVNMLLASVFKPFFDFAKEGLEGLNTLLGSEGVQASMTAFGETAVGVFQSAIEIIKGIAGAVGEWVAANGPLLDQLVQFAASGFGAFVDVLRGFAEIVGGLAGAIGSWSDANGPLLEQLVALTSASIVGGIQSVADVLLWLGSNDVGLALSIATAAVLGVVAALHLLAAHPVIGAIALIVTAIGLARTAWEDDWQGIRTAIEEAAPQINDVLDAIYVAFQVFARAVELLGLGIELMWEETVGAFQRAAEVITGVMATIPGPMQETYRQSHEILQGMANDTEARADDIEAEMARIAQAPMDHLPIWAGGVDGFRASVEAAVNPTTDAARRLANGVVVPLDAIDLYQSGANAVASFAAGITASAWRVQSAAAGVAQVMKKVMPQSEPKDPTSPFRGITHWGFDAANIIIDGWRRAIPAARDVAAEFGQAMTGMGGGNGVPGLAGAALTGSSSSSTVYYTGGPVAVHLPVGWQGTRSDVKRLGKELADEVRLAAPRAFIRTAR